MAFFVVSIKKVKKTVLDCDRVELTTRTGGPQQLSREIDQLLTKFHQDQTRKMLSRGMRTNSLTAEQLNNSPTSQVRANVLREFPEVRELYLTRKCEDGVRIVCVRSTGATSVSQNRSGVTGSKYGCGRNVLKS